MRIGSLFSGAGGLDLAVEHVFGAVTAWHCEIDPAASKVLAHRWPGVPNLGDITQTDFAGIAAHGVGWDFDPIDILCGGYPCQPFSAAGQRKGADDERHLWPYFAEAIRVLRPRYVILENVAGHRSMGLDQVLADLAGIRYVGSWCSLRASDVGAPHRRERVFILATDMSRSAGRDTEQQCVSPLWPRRGAAVQQSRECGDANTTCGGDASDSACNGRHQRRPQPARLKRGSDAALSGHGPVDLLPTPTISDTKTPQHAEKRFIGGHQINLADAAITVNNWGKYEPAIRRWEQQARPAPSPTEHNKNGNPRLAAAFAEWMMGWPAGWVTDPAIGISRNDQLRIIGNGVVPQQATAALQWLLQVSEVAA